MNNLKVYGDVSGDLRDFQFQMPVDASDLVLLEAPDGGCRDAWVVDTYDGMLVSLEGLARHNGVSPDEMRRHLREKGVTGGGDTGDSSGAGVTAPPTHNMNTSPVPAEELDADLDQGTVRKTVRNLDQGAVAAIREVTGASSDAEAVREAVLLAKDVLVKD